MTVYKIINPSDPYHLTADDLVLAALAARQPVSETVAYQQGFRHGQDRTCTVAASQPMGEPVAWVHEEDPSRVISASQKATALRDQGASGSSVRPYSVPAYLHAPAAQAVDLTQEPMFYIQDTRQFVGNCPVWWGPNGSGYVTRLDEAGRYTEQEAVKKNRCRETDIPWPCAEIEAIARRTVDFQHMRPRAERLAELALIDSHSAGGQP